MSEPVPLLLLKLEAELKQLQLWSATPPAPYALASTMPFCVDTMALQSWLQFVLIPRMQALLDAGTTLPTRISISPFAEEAFSPLGEKAKTLLQLIAALDDAVSKV